MKLLVCTYEYFPNGSGIANVVYNIVRELEKKGVDCTVCSPTGPDIRLGNRRLIAKTGILGLMDFWLKVSKLDMTKYDAVWLNQPISLRKISHKNLVVTVHTTYHAYDKMGFYPWPYYRLAAFLEKLCLEKLDQNIKFVSISADIKNELSEIGIDKNRITCIPNGVDTHRFKPIKGSVASRIKLGLPENKKILLSVGRLTEQKQPCKLIELFSHLEKKDGNLFLAIAGKGELLEKSKDYAASLGVKNIRFLGFVPDKILPKLYSTCDYYILLSKYEGQPLTLLEAMSSGLPTIVSNLPNLNIVEKNNAGISLNLKNMNSAAAKAIEFTKKNPALYSKNARKYAECVDWKNIAFVYLKIYNLRA